MTEDNINMLIYMVGAVAIIFLWMFRKPLTDLIGNAKSIKIEVGKLKAEINSFVKKDSKKQSSNERDVLKKDSKKQSNDERDVFCSFVRTEKEAAIKAEIDARDLDADGKINLLISRLSIAYLKSMFYRVYRFMSRREIQLLREFNSYRGEKGWGKKEAELYCQQAVKNSSGVSGRPIDEGIDFLIDFFLIEIENDSYRITDFGIDFLAWLVIEGKTRK